MIPAKETRNWRTLNEVCDTRKLKEGSLLLDIQNKCIYQFLGFPEGMQGFLNRVFERLPGMRDQLYYKTLLMFRNEVCVKRGDDPFMLLEVGLELFHREHGWIMFDGNWEINTREIDWDRTLDFHNKQNNKNGTK